MGFEGKACSLLRTHFDSRFFTAEVDILEKKGEGGVLGKRLGSGPDREGSVPTWCLLEPVSLSARAGLHFSGCTCSVASDGERRVQSLGAGEVSAPP